MSDGRREDDLSSLAWPGFVDILSSVIMMFIFFVLITAVALYFHIIIYKSKILQETSVSVAEEVITENKLLKEKAKTLEEKLETIDDQKKSLENILAEYEQELYQTRAEFTESTEQEITTNESGNEIVVFFGRDSISLTPESKDEIANFLNAYASRNNAKRAKVEIIAGKNPQTPIESVARKLSVARMLNARNAFLDTDIPLENIDARVDSKESINDSYHWVKIRLAN